MDLAFPSHLSPERRDLLTVVAERADREHDDNFLGLVLSGSAGRGLATERSEVDVEVVFENLPEGSRTSKSPTIDEGATALSELDELPTFGTDGWWYRWSYAWAPVLLDRTEGALTDAVRRQGLVSPEEADSILIEHDRLDGWLNYAYRVEVGPRRAGARAAADRRAGAEGMDDPRPSTPILRHWGRRPEARCRRQPTQPSTVPTLSH